MINILKTDKSPSSKAWNEMVKDFEKREAATKSVEEARAIHKEGWEKGIYQERMRLEALADVGHLQTENWHC